MLEKDKVEAKRPMVKSWTCPENHLERILTDDWYASLFKIYSGVIHATSEFYKDKGVSPCLFPLTTGSISSPMGAGSDSLPVKIKIKGNDVYLADSMQFCLEIGVRLNTRGVYYIMPTFRGESLDERHLNEFFHSEAEIKGGLKDVMMLVEGYVRYMGEYFYKHHYELIKTVAGTTAHLERLVSSPEMCFKNLRYEDALTELIDSPNYLNRNELGLFDITKQGERELLKRYGDFIWLTNMPWHSVPFYQARESGTNFAMNADLLAGIGEIVGCGQRVNTYADLKESLTYHSVDETPYKWYGDMRNMQPMQTSGFGLGVERFILWLTQHSDIRDCMLLIRDHKYVNQP